MNKLEYLDEFKDILTNYHISKVGKKVIEGTTLVLCSGVTASGRNTVIAQLLTDQKYYYVVSDTTRKPRINDGVPEKSGEVYWFRTEKQMLADLEEGKMVEAEIIHQQQVSGMSAREIAKAKENGQIAITDADSGGVKIVVAAKPNTICLFFVPPSFDEWQRRIRTRGEMPLAEKIRRLKTAADELRAALKYDYYKLVINDEVEDTAKKVDAIVANPEHPDPVEQAQAKKVAQKVLKKTEEFLQEVT
jgi:guanylate kinase